MKLDTQLLSYFAEVNLLGKKDFVDVARETLNSAAVQTKKKFIPQFAKNKFTVRRKNFFTALTSVNYSKRGQSSELGGLFSEVGFIKNDSTKNMYIQEFGGTISRPVKPLNASRVGKSYNRPVSKKSMFKGDLLKQSNMNGKTEAQRMAILLKMARKNGSEFVNADEYNTIYKITANNIRGVFYFKLGNTEDLKDRNLIGDSSNEARKIIAELFISEAKKKIKYRASKVKY